MGNSFQNWSSWISISLLKLVSAPAMELESGAKKLKSKLRVSSCQNWNLLLCVMFLLILIVVVVFSLLILYLMFCFQVVLFVNCLIKELGMFALLCFFFGDASYSK